ncbi:transporter substrate-binding domain-containing protein [Magnetovibrio sp. PR-2]|uniref:transporter substrate-binding domain-containing protein n=1 Tax=Magnetovibrio sp. PR-2 TaxID=3120356 RepID=UPI002FCE35B7
MVKLGTVLCVAIAVLSGCQTTKSLAPGVYQSDTLRTVKERGVLNCGISELDGFAYQDRSGTWHGLDVDMCRAIATAVLGSHSKVFYVPVSAKTRFKSLQSGVIDVLARYTTWTLTRDVALGLDFVGPNFIEGMAVLVREDLGVMDVRQMDGATYCLLKTSMAELHLATYYLWNKMRYNAVVFDTVHETMKGLDDGRCHATILDSTGLSHQLKFMKNAQAFKILPQRLSFEPLSLGVRQDDRKWLNIVRAVMSGLLLAEEAGRGPDYNLLLEDSRRMAVTLGIYTNWLQSVIDRVGDYGEIYNRNFGLGQAPFQRGLNSLASHGGMMVPFRFGDLVFARPQGLHNTEEVYNAMRARGHVRCGVVKEPGEPGASGFRSKSAWRDFSIETCRTFATALFQDPDQVEVFDDYLDEQLKALAHGEIDMIGSPTVRDLNLIGAGFDQPVTSFINLHDGTVVGMGPVILGGHSMYSDSVRWAIWARQLHAHSHNAPGWAQLFTKKTHIRASALNFKTNCFEDILNTFPSVEESLGEKAASQEIYKLNTNWNVGGVQYSAPIR